jgi:outer membrane autotransporter protein
MLMTKEQRYVLKNRNKFAISEGQTSYDPTYDSKYGWARPYATFESVRLKNGPKVSNVAYGSFFGGESEMYDLGHGWDGMLGVYAGYNGSHQAYDGIGIYQNGGTLGVTGMAYKGNFFTGLTINAGANVGEASTAYGSDNFTMLMAGIASKTGYNVELADGKFIIQPSFLMSYSFVNTFDYTNAAGIRIDSDPLHAIQLEPGLKFIGNLKNGWQPYVGVSMVWNIMDKTNFNANEASLPDLSVKPYVKYGVGVRKTWGERLSGFIQAFFTNGGRNGLGLQAGFRFAIGKEGAPVKVQNSKPEMPKTQIKLSGLK